MSEPVVATKVIGAGDWQGVYIGDERRYENHSASIEDVQLEDDEMIASIEQFTCDMKRLGITSLPRSLAELKRRVDLAQEIADSSDMWATKIEKLACSSDPIDKERLARDLGVDEETARILMACFSPPGVRGTTTPLGEPAIIKFDADSSGYIRAESADDRLNKTS